jgi:regulator of chromosome condensation
MKGGSHHSIAVTQDGKCLVWGRLDGKQMGIPISDLPSDRVVSHEGRPRILEVPTAIESLPAIAYATAGSDHSIAITKDGQAYSWGFGANYQLGLGEAEDVEIPTLIENTAVRGKKLVWAGAGGQFSVIAGPAEVKDVEMTDT